MTDRESRAPISGLSDPRLRKAGIVLGVVLLILGTLYHGRQLLSLRPLEGAGTVAAKDESGLTATLTFQEGGTLRVVGISSRIDLGDRVEKRAGSFTYVVNDERHSPVPILIGSVLLFWLFVPALALFPVFIYVGVKQE